MRNVLWDPKPRVAAALRLAGLPFEISGADFFRSLGQWRSGSLLPGEGVCERERERERALLGSSQK